MKIEIPTTRQEEVVAIYMVLPIRYEEEEIPNDFPFRIGETWAAAVDIDTGKIRDWPVGRTADIHLTVKDGGTYTLLNAEGKVVAAIEEDYVPHRIVPGSFGDTVELSIAGDGTITNWPKNPDASDFFPED